MALRSGRVGIHPSQVDPITGMLLNGPAPGSVSFEDLSDAQISNPEAGQTLIFNGTGWENEFSSISATTLAALRDVEITDPEDGEYLVYDATNSKWINSGSAPGPEVPEGSTVTPTDDIQKWLNCAGIFDKVTYTTLADVLADSTTLLALMSDNNAVDYLVRSTNWASGVTADSTAMTDIGANNYCANTLLDDATWCDAICNSTYFESVLNAKVPTMTSDTTPSGECVAHTNTISSEAYKAFDGSNSTYYVSAVGEANNDFYVGYNFPSAVKICKAVVTGNSYNASYYYDNAVYGGNSLSALTKLSGDMRNQSAMGTNTTNTEVFVCPDQYTYFVLKITDTNAASAYVNGVCFNALYMVQFYGRKDI